MQVLVNSETETTDTHGTIYGFNSLKKSNFLAEATVMGADLRHAMMSRNGVRLTI